MGYKLLELAAVRLASRASSFIDGDSKQPLLSSSDPGSVTSPSAISIEAWLPVYGTPDISGNGRQWADVSASTSSVPDVAPPLLALLHSGRRTAPTAATGRPDPAGRPAEIQPHLSTITTNLQKLTYCDLKFMHSILIERKFLDDNSVVKNWLPCIQQNS